MEQDLIYIYEVYQCGSFSQAAKKLFMTQPALSIAVQKVEKSIGYPIFERYTKPLQLTEAGKIYIKNILQLKQLEKDLSNALQDLSLSEQGELRIAGTQYFNSHVLPPTLKLYMERYPQVNVSLLESNSGSLDSNLEKGNVDITLHCGDYDAKKYVGFDIFKDYLLLAVPKIMPVNKQLKAAAMTGDQVRNGVFVKADIPVINLTAFRETPFLILTQTNDLRRRSLAMFKQAGFEPNIRFAVEQLETARYLAENDLGATFLSDRLIHTMPSDNMFYYKLPYPEALRHYRAIMRKQSYISNITKSFIAMLQDTWRGTINEA